MSKPFFSIVIPAHNAEGHIRVLLNSIREQTFSDYEIIVVCDSCTARPEEIAREYGAITDRVQFGCDGLTRDRALELVSGEWILFADDDDWFLRVDSFQTLADFIRTQIGNIGFSFFDEFYSGFVHLGKIVGCEEETVFPVCTEPFDILKL